MKSATCGVFVVVLTILLAAQGIVATRPHRTHENEIPSLPANLNQEGSNQALKALCERCKKACSRFVTGTESAVEFAEAQDIVKRFCQVFTFGLGTDACAKRVLSALQSAQETEKVVLEPERICSILGACALVSEPETEPEVSIAPGPIPSMPRT